LLNRNEGVTGALGAGSAALDEKLAEITAKFEAEKAEKEKIKLDANSSLEELRKELVSYKSKLESELENGRKALEERDRYNFSLYLCTPV